MAFGSLGSLKNALFGKNTLAEQYNESIGQLQAQHGQDLYDAMRNQQNAYAPSTNAMQGMGGFQNTLVQKGTLTAEEIARRRQEMEHRLAVMQMEYDQKFKEEAYIKGAVSMEELDSAAYSLSLEEVRTIWLAAFGSRWVAQESMEGDHRLMFQRLYTNNEFESAIVTDPATRAFKTRYRLKGS